MVKLGSFNDISYTEHKGISSLSWLKNRHNGEIVDCQKSDRICKIRYRPRKWNGRLKIGFTATVIFFNPNKKSFNFSLIWLVIEVQNMACWWD